MIIYTGTGVATEADRLLRDSAADQWALISPSVYETGRLVSDAPWLAGHAARLRYLCREQADDGGWGMAGFRLVATLSATEALLTACRSRSTGDRTVPHETLAQAAGAGVLALHRWLADGTGPLPDLVAVELVVPHLIDLINEHLARHDEAPEPYLPGVRSAGRVGVRLTAPPDTDPALLRRLRRATAAGQPVPPKLWHSWEILTSGRPCDPLVEPAGGTVGCSPAATAAWLGQRTPAGHPSVRYLDTVQARGSGTVPVGAPMPYFERSWILTILAAHGVPHTAPADLLDSLEQALGPDGAPAGTGLPVDADDTASVLLALELNGRGRRPDSLMSYYDGERFFTYPGERTPSPTANAHAIETLGYRMRRHPGERPRYAGPLCTTVAWLIDAQDADGHWDDKWHGSPYYATACCATALARYGGERARTAVERAVSWMLQTRQEHRWGHGTGTVEETAYAVWTLLLGRRPERAAEIREALAAAGRALSEGAISDRDPGLWIGKDVYLPVRIVRATHLAALHQLRIACDGH